MPTEGYFKRVTRLSPTRLWINNPTSGECALAIAAGAISCTTNPTFVSKQLAREDREHAVTAIREAVKTAGSMDEATDYVQRMVIMPVVEKFLPLWQSAPGEQGFVSIQGNPLRDDDDSHMIQECLRARELGPNVIAKVPVTRAGLKTIESLVEEDVPVIATEIMSISQAVATAETYARASSHSGNTPPLYITHITGIFDDHLRNVVERDAIPIGRDLLWQAGLVVARRQYALMRDRGYPGRMLGGGARGAHHFTELVGGEADVTINWQGTADHLIGQNPPIVYRIGTPTPQHVVDELLEKIPDFRLAYEEGALPVQDFLDYGPVQLFRSSFVKGWRDMEAAIAAEGGNW